jgi:hypothetical protein
VKRSLNLTKETLAELTTADLSSVAGGATMPCAWETKICLTGVYPTLPVQTCLCDILDGVTN